MPLPSARLAPLLLLCAACAAGDEEAPPARETPPVAVAPDTTLVVADAGLAGPESALYDAAEELYLVSNINGEPTAEDGNGFISRVLPDGEVVALRWIDGADNSVSLNAPKGMALLGDTLVVADIDMVRLFHRATGRPLGEWPVPGSAFLNDVTVGPDGSVYVTDTGMLATSGGMERTNADALYRFQGDGRPQIVLQGPALQGPNGVAVGPDGVVVASWNAARLARIREGAEPEPLAELPKGQLDGLVRLPDGDWLVSSWEAEAVFRVSPDGTVSVFLEGLVSPADIGLDPRRQRLLVPLLTRDRLEIHPLPRSP